MDIRRFRFAPRFILLFALAFPLFAFATTFTCPLVVGSTGSDVTALQQILVQQGFLNTTATGFFGPLTAAASAKFQTAHGIEALGWVGPKTRTLLNSLSGTPTSKSDLVASLPRGRNTRCSRATRTSAWRVGDRSSCCWRRTSG